MGILLVIEYHKEARISIVYMPFFRNHFKIKPTKVWITVIWFRYKKLDKSILFTRNFSPKIHQDQFRVSEVNINKHMTCCRCHLPVAPGSRR